MAPAAVSLSEPPQPATSTAEAARQLRAISARLTQWLSASALPLWSTAGTDRIRGGFFEKLDVGGRPIEEPRRTRVVARQIYVFATAARLGWIEPANDGVTHGLAFLFDRLRRSDGSFAASVQIDGSPADAGFDLYEHAFVLFALAAAHRTNPTHGDLAEHAHRLLGLLRRRWGHALGGFHEAAPPTIPLRSNPHMHLLEAASAWAETACSAAVSPWEELADELTQLCTAHFIDARTGAIREFFDLDWRPMPGAPGRVVEPGHQFEWAWLFARRGTTRNNASLLAAARRLAVIGETHGVDPVRGVAINALRDDFTIADASAKLWPQTERIKAWCALANLSQTEPEATEALTHARHAAEGLWKYVVAAPPGQWLESMNEDGSFSPAPTRASSLYHIVCAIETLHALPLGPVVAAR